MRLHPKNNETGSILITILVMLVIVSLGAGVAVVLNSSSMQSVGNNIALRATNLAEAGFRYAGTEYANVGSGSTRYAQKLSRLEAMNQEQVVFNDGNGSFTLSIHPYFFMSDSYGGTTDLSLRVPGKFPDDFKEALPKNGTVCIDGTFYDYTKGTADDSGADEDSDTFDIKLASSVSISKDDPVFLSFSPQKTSGVVPIGNDLTVLSSSDADLGPLLPDRNGLITVYEGTASGAGAVTYNKAGTYRYRKRQTKSDGTIQLTDIQDYEDGGSFISLGANDLIVIPTQVDITSTGTIGTGAMACSREISLNVFLTEDVLGFAGEVEDLDLNGSDSGTAETFDGGEDEALDNWSAPDGDIGSYLSTSQEVVTEYTPAGSSAATNFLTFQNFTTEDESSDVWYMTQIDKIHLDCLGKGTADADGYYSSYYNLYGVWGNDDDNMFIVGENGVILHYDGTEFNLETAVTNTNNPITQTLRAVWGVPSAADVADAKANNQDIPIDKVFVVGNHGTTLIDESDTCANGPACWEVASITSYSSGSQPSNRDTADLYAAYGTSWWHFDAYGEIGANPYNWDDSEAANDASGLKAWTMYPDFWNFRCLWAIDYEFPQDVNYGWAEDRTGNQNLIVGRLNTDEGLILHEFYGTYEADKPLNGVWGSFWADSGSDLYAVGEDGKVYHNTVGGSQGHEAWKNGWTDITSTVWGSNTKVDLNGIYGNTSTDFYMVGDYLPGGDATILYYDGNFHKAQSLSSADPIKANLNSIWGSQETGIWAVGDNGTIVYLGRPANSIEGYILPFDLSKVCNDGTGITFYDEVNTAWKENNELLTYIIQLKQVWANKLNYAAAGVNFRWNDNSGYGVSFMRYEDITSITDDGIPNDIKPSNDLDGKFLIVLWKKQGTTYTWLAYKDISSDSYMVKTETDAGGKKVITGISDLASLIVRVDEKHIDGDQVNDISVYYGNSSASPTEQKGAASSDQICNNTTRNRYNATISTITPNDITWPSNFEDWGACDDDTCSVDGDEQCCNIDIFTLVDGWTINGTQSVTLTGDDYVSDYILRTSEFITSRKSDKDLDSSNEWAIHAFGDVGSFTDSATLSVTDFAVQLGADPNGDEDSPSIFSDIQ